MTMRKTLLSTTAIVGASMLGAAAAQASDPPALALDGFLRFEAKWVDQDFSNGRSHGLHFESDDAGFNMNAAATADNGLKYSAKIEIDTDGANAGVDETRIRFAGDWGILDLGDEDGAEDAMAYGGENQQCYGQCGYDGGAASAFNFIGARKASPNLGTGGGDTGDASKITYYTPRIGNFQLGISYTPDSGNNLASTISASDQGDIRNVVGLGLNYVDTLGDVSVRLHGTGAWGDTDDDAAATLEDATGYMLGMGLGWTDWNLAVGYGNAGDGLQTVNGGQDNGEWISTGLSYAPEGDWGYAIGYFMGEASRAAGEEDTDFFTANATYTWAPGLQLYGEFDWIDVFNPSSTITNTTTNTLANQNEGMVVTLGTRVTF